MSQPVHTSYPKYEFKRGLVNNSTDADFGVITPTTTKPATVDSATPTANQLVADVSGQKAVLIFFGQDTDGDQLTARVTLWRKTDGATPLWVPHVVGQFELTLGAAVGVAGAQVINTEFFVDTITEVGTTWDDALVSVSSAADNTTASAYIDTAGYELMQVDFDINLAGGTDGTAANVLYAFR